MNVFVTFGFMTCRLWIFLEAAASRPSRTFVTLESTTSPSHIATFLYALRYLSGRVFDWDREPMQPEDSFLERLSERDHGIPK